MIRLTGDARLRFFDKFYALLEEQVRRARREAMTVGCKPTRIKAWLATHLSPPSSVRALSLALLRKSKIYGLNSSIKVRVSGASKLFLPGVPRLCC